MSNLTAAGKSYAKGSSFRAHAEAQQRSYRAQVLKVADDGRYGHLLCADAAKTGKNFLTPIPHAAVLCRSSKGKGISLPRTQGNMLSSQAMCFNLFAPLAGHDNPEGRDLLAQALAPFVGHLGKITNVDFEYTPAPDVFGDQSGAGGVDCDVLIQFGPDTAPTAILAIETKFVEEGFSTCGFCKPKARTRCPAVVALSADRADCLYSSKKQYRYWRRSDEHNTLRPEAIQSTGCPFAGQMWQLWVNHTLAQVEKSRRRAAKAIFAVCAPSANKKLLRNDILSRFQAMLTDPDTFAFIPLEALIIRLQALTAGQPKWHPWLEGLQQRYILPNAPATA